MAGSSVDLADRCSLAVGGSSNGPFGWCGLSFTASACSTGPTGDGSAMMTSSAYEGPTSSMTAGDGGTAAAWSMPPGLMPAGRVPSKGVPGLLCDPCRSLRHGCAQIATLRAQGLAGEPCPVRIDRDHAIDHRRIRRLGALAFPRQPGRYDSDDWSDRRRRPVCGHDIPGRKFDHIHGVPEAMKRCSASSVSRRSG